jgi:MFS family permease
VFCKALLVAGYTIIVCKVPFPAVVVSYFLIGLGIAINLSLNNVFLANMVNGTEILGVAHGSYGIGGTIAPLVATALASHGVHWTYFYFINLALATFICSIQGGRSKDMRKSCQCNFSPPFKGLRHVRRNLSCQPREVF